MHFGQIKEIVLYVAVIVAALLIHVLKAFRLYLALYGNGNSISRRDFVKLYMFTTPISILLPFKLGDLFRMFCYGKKLKNYIRGTVIILLDRCQDTVALLAVILLFGSFWNKTLLVFGFLLAVFMCLVIACYKMFPGFYGYWKKYLLRETATQRKIWALKGLENCRTIYLEAEQVIRGKGMLMLLLSFFAWFIEIVSAINVYHFYNQIVNQNVAVQNIYNEIGNAINQYLSSAVLGTESVYLERFAVVSVSGLWAGFIALGLIDFVRTKLQKR